MSRASELFPRYASVPAQDLELVDSSWSLLEDVAAETLTDAAAALAADRGVDVATAALFVRASLRIRSLREELERFVEARSPRKVQVLVVPGALHQHHDDTGADGKRLVAIAKREGMAATVARIPSLGMLDANAAVLARELAALDGPVVVVSLCKGSADMKKALSLPSAADVFSRVVGWLDLCGPLEGTQFVRLLRNRRLLHLGVTLQLAWRGLTMEPFKELTCEPGGIGSVPLSVPPHMRRIRMLGFPLARHLSHRWSLRGHKGMAHLGPNDGGGLLLAPAASWDPALVPVFGADHHLRPQWDLDPYFAMAMRLLAARAK